MQDCIFCQIVAGRSPSYKIYEDEIYLGILDIYPLTKGHVLVVPKQHYRWVHDVPEFGEYWRTALKIAKVLEKTLSPKWVQYFTHGYIPHAHIHVIPRYEETSLAAFLPKGKITLSKEEMTEIAEKIRKAL